MSILDYVKEKMHLDAEKLNVLKNIIADLDNECVPAGLPTPPVVCSASNPAGVLSLSGMQRNHESETIQLQIF